MEGRRGQRVGVHVQPVDGGKRLIRVGNPSRFSPPCDDSRSRSIRDNVPIRCPETKTPSHSPTRCHAWVVSPPARTQQEVTDAAAARIWSEAAAAAEESAAREQHDLHVRARGEGWGGRGARKAFKSPRACTPLAGPHALLPVHCRRRLIGKLVQKPPSPRMRPRCSSRWTLRSGTLPTPDRSARPFPISTASSPG